MWSAEFLRNYYPKQQPTDQTPGIRRNRATYNNVQAVINAYICPGLGQSTPMATVTPDRLHEMVTDLRVTDYCGPTDQRTTKTRPADPHTRRIVAHVLRLMFAAAVPGILSANPAKKLPTFWATKGD
jgi:hypothetical protein